MDEQEETTDQVPEETPPPAPLMIEVYCARCGTYVPPSAHIQVLEPHGVAVVLIHCAACGLLVQTGGVFPRALIQPPPRPIPQVQAVPGLPNGRAMNRAERRRRGLA